MEDNEQGTTDGRETDRDQRSGVTRRVFLVDGAGVVAAGAVGPSLVRGYLRGGKATTIAEPHASQVDALRVLGRSSLRHPNSLPHPELSAATDTIPQIQHVVVLMMENHSYDNFLGMLGRQAGQTPRGGGFQIGADGYPTATNPAPGGATQRAFHMPTTCQLPNQPTQEWEQCHIQYDNGANDGFVISQSGPVSMGYWTGQDLPFTYALASQFPIGDRWFCSVLGQTDPNRRYLIAATSSGMTDDIGGSLGSLEPDALLGLPANGTIFERLSDAGISWADYNASFPAGATMELYPTNDALYVGNAKPVSQFFSDAQAGTLPSFSLVDPDYDTQSQENPQNIVVGESFLASVVNAIGNGPGWGQTLLIITYDEHGGYYDHVPPPAALAPDGVPPIVQPGESSYDGFAHYGFRVPSIVVGPYAKPGYVSSVVYDHTSILAFLERKWNLPAMTYRDANANDLTDFLDLNAMAAGQPTFPELPALPPSGENAATLACQSTGPGTIPPPSSVSSSASSAEIRVRLHDDGVRKKLRGLVLELWTSHSSLSGLTVELYHARRRRRIAHARIAKLTTKGHRVVLRVHHRPPSKGRYTVVVRHGQSVLLRRAIRVR